MVPAVLRHAGFRYTIFFWLFPEITVSRTNNNLKFYIKGVLVAGFMRPYKCFKMTRGDIKVYYRPNNQKNNRNFRDQYPLSGLKLQNIILT